MKHQVVKALFVYLSLVLWHADVAADPVVKELSGPVDSLDPMYATGFPEVLMAVDLFEGLTSYDRQGQVELAQAEEYWQSDDGLDHFFRLRPNLKWSDGTPLSAADFVLGAQRVLDPAIKGEFPRVSYALTDLKNATKVASGELPPSALGVEAVAPDIVKLTLEKKIEHVKVIALNVAMFPVPSHTIEKHGEKWAEPEHLVVNGAYRLQEKLEAGYLLIKNPFYRDVENVSVAQIKGVYLRDPNDVEHKIANGELDIAPIYIGTGDATWASETLQATLVDTARTAVFFVVLNAARPAFRDHRVRQALAMTVFQDDIAPRLYGSAFDVAYQFAPPPTYANWQGYVPAWADWSVEQRLAEARRLMTEAGYSAENPLKFTIDLGLSVKFQAVANALKINWKLVYVEMDEQILDSVEYNKRINAVGEDVPYDAYHSGFNAFYPSPLLMYHVGQQVFFKSVYPGSEAAAQQYQHLLDAAERSPGIENFDEIERFIRESVTVIPLFLRVFHTSCQIALTWENRTTTKWCFPGISG